MLKAPLSNIDSSISVKMYNIFSYILPCNFATIYIFFIFFKFTVTMDSIRLNLFNLSKTVDNCPNILYLSLSKRLFCVAFLWCYFLLQSGDMQWTYNVRGVLPDYRPPRAFSCKPISGPHPDPRKRTNQTSYVKDNLRLATTAVSSPIKGAPLMNIPNKPQPPQMWWFWRAFDDIR